MHREMKRKYYYSGKDITIQTLWNNRRLWEKVKKLACRKSEERKKLKMSWEETKPQNNIQQKESKFYASDGKYIIKGSTK